MADANESFAVEVDPFYVEDLEQMARATNYRQWQFGMVSEDVRGRVLEVGGGIGNFTCDLARVASQVVSIEPNTYCFRRLVAQTKAIPNIAAYNATVETLDQHLAPDSKFETVILMNVLEHIKDDFEVISRLIQRLVPGGCLVVLVPAGPWAYGEVDHRLGHYRRYGKGSMRRLLARLPLKTKKLRYYNFVGIWGWYWNARVSKRQNQSDAQIQIFDRWLVPVISLVERFIRPPVGQSLLAVASRV